MTEKQFVVWLKGFTEACHHLAPTPAQWEKIIETLKSVQEETHSCTCDSFVYQYKDGNYVSTTDKKQLND